MGTVIDIFAVLVLIGLIASSIRRYVFTPAGLQRTADATIVVSLIAALMVTYLLAEAGGHVKGMKPGRAEPHWSQTWLPAGMATAKAMQAAGVSEESIVKTGVASWWLHAGILLFFLVYLPYSKHMHLMWAPLRCFSPNCPTKARCRLFRKSPKARGRNRRCTNSRGGC